MAMRLVRFDDASVFLDRVGAYLAEREAEHNLLFGILDALILDPKIFDGPPYLAAVLDADRVLAVALRTPPRNLVLSEIDDHAAVDAIVADVVALGDPIPGVVGPVEVARRFAELFSSMAGRPHRPQMAERAFRLSRVTPPPPVAGAMRLADRRDFDLLVEWYRAFVAEALPEEVLAPHEAEKAVTRWIDHGYRRNYLWEVDGEVVSWTGVGGRTPNGIRVGPVYTPPEHRGRGYASALVAAASQAQLDEGLAFCFLFTDLANPTSNHIYQAIGYEPVTDIDVYVFD